MNILKQTKEICRLYDIKPNRSRGQNFLINEDVYDKIVEAANIKKSDSVLEVGPGLGFLTAKLSLCAKSVIAVELDEQLANFLKVGFSAGKGSNVEIINESILDYNPPFKNYKIVANLPYNITSIFLRKFLSRDNKPKEMVLMLQKEVAERITAKVGGMSLLSVSINFFADSEIIDYVPAHDFFPQPEVDSAIIKIKIKDKLPAVDEKEFFRLVKIGFSAKRKMLKNNLANGYHITQKEAENLIKKAGFGPMIRAQELSLGDWQKLLFYFA